MIPVADAGILFSEPRYKIDEFVDEIAERRATIQRDLRDQLERLRYTLLEQFARRVAVGALGRVGFGTPRWTPDGRLIIDTWLSDVPTHTRSVGEIMGQVREQLDTLTRGLVDQVAMLKKHALLFEPRHLRFGTPRWQLDGTVVMDLRYRGRPFQPHHDVRWY